MGNCCLQHPFSSVLEPRQGGDICSLAGLTWPHVIIPATMSSLQYRHGALTPLAWHHVLRPPIRWVLSGWWVFMQALPVYSLPTIARYMVVVSLLRAITLKLQSLLLSSSRLTCQNPLHASKILKWVEPLTFSITSSIVLT